MLLQRVTFGMISIPFLTITSRYPNSLFINKRGFLLNRRGLNETKSRGYVIAQATITRQNGCGIEWSQATSTIWVQRFSHRTPISAPLRYAQSLLSYIFNKQHEKGRERARIDNRNPLDNDLFKFKFWFFFWIPLESKMVRLWNFSALQWRFIG